MKARPSLVLATATAVVLASLFLVPAFPVGPRAGTASVGSDTPVPRPSTYALAADDPARAEALAWLDVLESTYERGETDAFVALLTPNYVFQSPDRDILRRFPSGFSREDERASHARLFTGGTSWDGRTLPRALAVDVEFLDADVCPDPEHPGDAGHAVIHVRRACLSIRFADATAMRDEAPHAFWLVRTDEGWRCRRWVERPATGESLLAGLNGGFPRG